MKKWKINTISKNWKELIEEHVEATGSERGALILEHFQEYLPKFKKIIPNDYKKMIALSAKLEEKGMSTEQAHRWKPSMKVSDQIGGVRKMGKSDRGFLEYERKKRSSRGTFETNPSF